MPYLIRTYDKPGSADLRAATRPAHLEFLAPYLPRLLAAGALLDDDGSTPRGSLILFDSDDRAEAEALAADDPYTRAGLFERVEIVRWRKVIFAGEALA
ncbi:MAG: YciI family protein [Gammaproteobacteria bacterium]